MDERMEGWKGGRIDEGDMDGKDRQMDNISLNNIVGKRTLMYNITSHINFSVYRPG